MQYQKHCIQREPYFFLYRLQIIVSMLVVSNERFPQYQSVQYLNKNICYELYFVQYFTIALYSRFPQTSMMVFFQKNIYQLFLKKTHHHRCSNFFIAFKIFVCKNISLSPNWMGVLEVGFAVGTGERGLGLSSSPHLNLA